MLIHARCLCKVYGVEFTAKGPISVPGGLCRAKRLHARASGQAHIWSLNVLDRVDLLLKDWVPFLTLYREALKFQRNLFEAWVIHGQVSEFVRTSVAVKITIYVAWSRRELLRTIPKIDMGRLKSTGTIQPG